MSHDWLVLRLAAPLLSFGGVAVDQYGPTRDFPGASLLTGLFANALGWHWSDRSAHQDLQDRILFGACSQTTADVLTDVQNAQLSKTDKAWTTSGKPAGRDGASFNAPHRRIRDYLADQSTFVIVRLEPVDEIPNLKQLSEALDRPARPLYIGRKPCLPSCRLVNGWVQAETAHQALTALPGLARSSAVWPVNEGPQSGDNVDRVFELADLRNWDTGLHGGSRFVVGGRIDRDPSP